MSVPSSTEHRIYLYLAIKLCNKTLRNGMGRFFTCFDCELSSS